MQKQVYDITAKSLFSDMTDDMLTYFMDLNFEKIIELNIEFTTVERRDSDMVFFLRG